MRRNIPPESVSLRIRERARAVEVDICQTSLETFEKHGRATPEVADD